MVNSRLSASSLAEVASSMPVPGYDRGALTVGIVHFGVGGFHRSHQAMYLDQLMSEGSALDFAICGVGLLPGDAAMADALDPQDGLYTLIVKHADGWLTERVIGSILRYRFAPADPAAVLTELVDPAVRIVELTITEGGYNLDEKTGRFDAEQADVQHDLANPDTPRTVFGYVIEALRRRRDHGTAPFTISSCDNIPGNGVVAQRAFASFARLSDPELADWIEREVAFPNAMVDRITPVATDADRAALTERHGVTDLSPVVCEPFTQWVLQDSFPTGRPEWDRVGVQLVDDVEPYELMKLRLLNASHQALAYLGYLAGWRFVHDAMADPDMVALLERYMLAEGSPTLPPVPGVDLADYRATLVERFANPEIADTLARLAAFSSDRIPTWLVPVVQHNLAHDGEIAVSATVIAAWARYAEGTDEDGAAIDIVDQRAAEVTAAAARQDDRPLAFLENRTLFGDLIDDERFTAAYSAALSSLKAVGSRATMRALLAGEL